jgi:two-component system, NarL family, nitrate/nitrite response regulator NarL
MQPGNSQDCLDSSGLQDALVVSQVRFLRESLVEVLVRAPGVRVWGQAATLVEALASAEAMGPGILLLDAAFSGGAQSAIQLCSAVRGTVVIVLGVFETEENVLAWAEAGVAGYVPNTASVDDLIQLIGQINRGEQACPPLIVGGMWRRIGASGRRSRPAPASSLSLTARETEVFNLLGDGLSNKDIARRLRISLGTTKTHVHNLLAKLSLPRRIDVMARMRAARYASLDGGPR